MVIYIVPKTLDKGHGAHMRVRCSTSSPPLAEHADLAFLLVDVDANMVHG